MTWMRSKSSVFLLPALLLLLALGACDSAKDEDPPDLSVPGVDSTAPSAVTDLAVVAGASAGSADLTWTAPGDDGAIGTAAAYVVVYSTSPITASNFGSATVFTQTWAPSMSGFTESQTVTGLTDGESYYFALKAEDEVPNTSAVSNMVFLSLDSTAPGAITDLAAAPGTGQGTVELTWTAVGDDASLGTAALYTIKYSTTALDDASFDAATTHLAPAPRTSGSTERTLISGLIPQTTYYFAIKVTDDGAQTGAISNVPTASPTGLGEITAIAAGQTHCLALRSDGTVWAWGQGSRGQLGIGAHAEAVWTPTQVLNLSGVTAIAAGARHSIALLSDGSVWAWGDNTSGQCGDNTTDHRFAPVQVKDAAGTGTLASISAIAAGGYHNVALDSSGNVWAWGQGTQGELGDSTSTTSPLPVAPTGLSGIQRIWAGGAHSFAELSNGALMGWGDNDYGQLGYAVGDQSSPVNTAYVNVTMLAPGLDFTVALESDGTLLSTGRNTDRSLGQEFTTTGAYPIPASVLDGYGSDFASVASIWCSPSATHVFAIKTDGSIYAWGRGTEGQFGRGSLWSIDYPVSSLKLSGLTAMACGATFGMGIKSDGTVHTWGGNSHGQMGRRNTSLSTEPGTVIGTSGVTAAAAGEAHSAAVFGDGLVRTWGWNHYGQLGDGTYTDQNLPQVVPNLGQTLDLAAGANHTVAVLSDNTVVAWGRNHTGQLGDGSTTDSTAPVAVTGLSNAVAVSAGAEHTVALLNDGTVWAWGRNDSGQLGDGTLTDSATPVQVSGLTGVTAVACGYFHTLALKGDGTVWAWGRNTLGQLGDTTLIRRFEPVQISLSAVAVAIDAGDAHSAAVLSDGTLWTWGSNYYGQLGDGTLTDSSTPVQVTELSSMADVICGVGFTIALGTDGRGYGFGRNTEGALGNGTIDDRHLPMELPGLKTGAGGAGGYHALILDTSGQLFAMGRNPNGQLGEGTLLDRSYPTRVGGFRDPAMIDTGGTFCSALSRNRTVWIWGGNGYGENGTNFNMLIPSPQTSVSYTALSGITKLAGEPYHTVALDGNGDVWTWGYNNYGQIGNSNTSFTRSAYHVPGIHNVTHMACGREFTVVLRTDGTVWAWGRNDLGCCGNGREITREYRPVQVQGLTNVIDVQAGYRAAMALKSDGTVWTWGDGFYGQIGNGSTFNSCVPVQVTGLSNITQIVGGYTHFMAVRNDGTLWAWGDNDDGRLGNDNGETDSPLPVQVKDNLGTGFLTNVSKAVAGYHSMALLGDGTVWVWGDNSYGQLGMGTTDGSTHPLPVQLTWTGGGTVTDMVCSNLACALIFSDGSIRTWGDNSYSLLGASTIVSQRAPENTLDFVTNPSQLNIGHDHANALLSDGTVWSWGRGDRGHNCDGTGVNRTTAAVQAIKPDAVFQNAVSIDAGWHTWYAVLQDGTVWAQGYDGTGALGDGGAMENSSIPVQVGTLSGIRHVSAGCYHGLAVLENGQVWGWGRNSEYQLGQGLGSNVNQVSPVQVGAFTDAVQVGGGYRFSLILRANGTVYSCGYNNINEGECGFDPWPSFPNPPPAVYYNYTPTQIAGLTNVTQIAAGVYHNLALRSDGTVRSWGRFNYGATGRAMVPFPIGNYWQPLPVTGLTNIVQVDAGEDTSIALKSDGTVWVWGRNTEGQLGQGTTDGSNHITPVQVPGLPIIIAVSASRLYYTVLGQDGSVWSWGANSYRNLGDGLTSHRSSPVRVQQQLR